MALIGLIFNDRAKVDLMELDASLNETHQASATATENEVEDGAKISDHINLNPLQLTIEGVVSETPLGLAGLLGSAGTAIAGQVSKRLGDGLVGGAATVGIASIGGLVASKIGPDGPESRSPQDVHTYLLELRDKRVPFEIITSLKKYDSMVLIDVNVPRNSQTGGMIRFTLQFKQIRIVTSSLVDIAVSSLPGAAQAQKTGKKAGSQTTDKTGKGSSALFKAMKFFGG